ncbi:MAG TPA: MFS transporter [Candidatus Binatia bacterium]|nr:MFS transporter [Candidatus Binatia bacterium]
MTAKQNPAAGKYPIAATAMALLLAGSLLPTPLFELYHRIWGLTPAEISFVFAVYAGSLIPSLLFLGGISDSIGRRRTILLSFAGMAIAALIFAFADGLIWLVIARIVQGMAIGIGTGAAAAAIREWMDEADRARAGEVTVIAVSVGSAFGALLGGSLAQYAPHPESLPFFVYIALLACIAVAVASVPTCPHLHPTANSAILTVPPAIRRPFLVASAQAFIGWSTFAIFISLVPSFLARSLDLHNLLTGALVITGIQVGSVTASLTGHRLPNRIAIVAALLALGGGLWLLLIGIAIHAYALIAIATLVTGAGGGLSYMVGLNIIGAISPPDHRAETLSAFLVACYLGFSIPALGVGIAANWFGLYAAFFGAAILLGIIAVCIMAFTTDRNLQVAASA